jgi:steroid delta-isomerase-like uncharacterized protein
MELLTIDFTEDGSCDDVTTGEHCEGRDGIKTFYRELYHAAPDLQLEVVSRDERGDAVTVDCLMHGTHKGDWNGIPATGTSFHVPAQVTYEFRKGSDVLRHEALSYDRQRLLEQFGVSGRPSRVQH